LRTGERDSQTFGRTLVLVCCLWLGLMCASARAQSTAPQEPDPSKPNQQQTSPQATPAQDQGQNPPQNPTPTPPQSTPPNPQQDQSNPPAPSTPQNPGQQPPPQEEKPKSIPGAAEDETKKLGEATLGVVQRWEIGWLTGPYAGRRRPLIPLTREQRERIYLLQTYLSPSAYLKRMLVAGIDQWRDSPAAWGQGWGAYGERFASAEGQFFAANTLAALGNAKLKYDPLYDQCQCGGFWPRTRHAIMRNFLAYNETESELRPQWALYGGAFAGGLIATTWRPHPHVGWGSGVTAMAQQGVYGSVLNLFIEFAGDINRKIWENRKMRGVENRRR
jgi:hypothetical protein